MRCDALAASRVALSSADIIAMMSAPDPVGPCAVAWRTLTAGGMSIHPTLAPGRVPTASRAAAAPVGIVMLYAIRVSPNTTIDTILAALRHTREEEVALVFPIGTSTALANGLETLYERCRAHGKYVVVIGGDEVLRASAVAAGFAAATTLAEWEADHRRAPRFPHLSWKPRRGKVTAPLPEPSIFLVWSHLSAEREDDPDDLYEIIGDDPPDYVADLVAADEELSPPHRHAGITTVPLPRDRRTHRLAERRRDAVEAAAVERAHLDYEEHLTRTIRVTGVPMLAHTSGLLASIASPNTPEPDLAEPDLADAPPADDEPRAPGE